MQVTPGHSATFTPDDDEPLGATRPDPASSPRLLASTARRLDHQIARALQGTFGARAGLQVLVGLATQQLLKAGATPEQIRHEVRRALQEHASQPDPTGAQTPDARAADCETLSALMQSWAESVYAPKGAGGGRRPAAK
jgi:hypothetical protein